MNPERRKKLAEKVRNEKVAMLRGSSASAVETTNGVTPESLIIWTRFYFIEPQVNESNETEWAVYRTTDLLSVNEQVDPIAPVHVYQMVTDAIVACRVLDGLVAKIEGQDAAEVDQQVVVEMMTQVSKAVAPSASTILPTDITKQ